MQATANWADGDAVAVLVSLLQQVLQREGVVQMVASDIAVSAARDSHVHCRLHRTSGVVHETAGPVTSLESCCVQRCCLMF